jgi:hypothetical protein
LEVLESDGEAVPAIVELRDSDDGVQQITTKLEVRSSISKVPCNGDDAWLELVDPSVVCWTRRSAASAERTGRRRSYHSVQEDKASLVAKVAWSRCPGASAISRRSLHLAAARSGQGLSRRPGARSGETKCQGGALG